LVKKLWVEIIEGAYVVSRKAVASDGQSLICDIADAKTKFVFSSTKQRKCGVCGQLGHNCPKCMVAPAATANLVGNNNCSMRNSRVRRANQD
jgi:hypothetical protein